VGKQSSEKILSSTEGRPLCRVNINAHSRKVLWQALVDRDANGGIVGHDCRIIARTGKYTDLCDVDNHMVSNLELVTAGAVVVTQNRPIINIMNQCTRMADRKTICSSEQMEHCKIIVNGFCNHQGYTIH
jgi:hypothetical protein